MISLLLAEQAVEPKIALTVIQGAYHCNRPHSILPVFSKYELLDTAFYINHWLKAHDLSATIQIFHYSFLLYVLSCCVKIIHLLCRLPKLMGYDFFVWPWNIFNILLCTTQEAWYLSSITVTSKKLRNTSKRLSHKIYMHWKILSIVQQSQWPPYQC